MNMKASSGSNIVGKMSELKSMVAQKWFNGSRFLKASLCIYARTFSAFNVRRREKKRERRVSERY